MADITVITPTLRGRWQMFNDARASVARQTIQVASDHELDEHGEGPSALRNRMVERASTEWIAFLDDDDRLYPDHCDALLRFACATGADLVYPWFDLYVLGELNNNQDPLRVQVDGQPVSPLGQPVTEELMSQIYEHNWIPVTHLVRRELVLDAGGFPECNTEQWPHTECEDWGLLQALHAAGAAFGHLPERTWRWNHNGQNTSGRPDRARAMGHL